VPLPHHAAFAPRLALRTHKDGRALARGLQSAVAESEFRTWHMENTKVLAIVGCARPEQVHCSADIVIVIFERVQIRFPSVCVRGEVHDAPGLPGLEHSTKNLFVSQIASLEGPHLTAQSWPLSRLSSVTGKRVIDAPRMS